MKNTSFPALILLMVVPVIVVSLVNKFVGGPPQEVVQWINLRGNPKVVSRTARAGEASTAVKPLNMKNSTTTITVEPEGLMYHFFVITMSLPPKRTSKLDLYISLSVEGVSDSGETVALHKREFHSKYKKGVDPEKRIPILIHYNELVGYDKYIVKVESMAVNPDSPQRLKQRVPLPSAMFRVTYISPEFARVQMFIKGLMSAVMVCAFIVFLVGLSAQASDYAHGQKWMCLLLLLVVGYNDPLYIIRCMKNGSEGLYIISTLLRIGFSSVLFLFWLLLADGISKATEDKDFASFYLPKLILILVYFVSAAILYLVYGRPPDDLMFSETTQSGGTLVLIVFMTASLMLWAVWLAFLMVRAVSRMGMKKVEYYYTDREKFFLLITVLFISMYLAVQVFKAVNGRHGSFLKLQLPLMVLVDQYVLLMTYKYWPSDDAQILERGMQMKEGGGREAEAERGILADDDDELAERA